MIILPFLLGLEGQTPLVMGRVVGLVECVACAWARAWAFGLGLGLGEGQGLGLCLGLCLGLGHLTPLLSKELLRWSWHIF